jgi:CMP-N-acetylneuraminic acid synthetase
LSRQKSPLVTVYIANFNYADYLEQSIQSILKQTFQNFELLIIDDGSSDNSRDIIRRYDELDRVYCIFQSNKGLNKTNNVALKFSRGKYLIRLDADDYMDEHALEIMVSDLEQNPECAIVFPDYYLIDEKGNITGQIRRHDFNREVSLADQPAHGACTMIRRDILIRIGGYIEKFDRQDGYDLWLRIIGKYPVSNINLPLFYYRQHGRNLTSSEEKLLKTRAEIKAQHVRDRKLPKLSTLGIIPVRGDLIDPRSLPLSKLGDKCLIDWTIEAVLESKEIADVLVSTPDQNVQEYVRKRYREKVTVYERMKDLARINVPLEPSLIEIIKYCQTRNKSYDLLALFFIEAPFRKALYIDKAVHTMQLYDVDVVDGIREEDDIYYYHNGHGLQPWKVNSGLRLERENLFRRAGGLHLVKREFIERGNELLSGRIGHVVLDQKAAFVIRSEMDWQIARYLAEMEYADG